MNFKQTLLIPLLFTTTILLSQTIYVVDQNQNAPSGDHVYSDLQDCIDNASDGDIIHIIPANEHYGTVTINKELHLVGSGWIPDNQSGKKSRVNKITFDSNTSNGSTLNGIVLVLTSTHPIVFGVVNAPEDTLKNIEIFNCYIPGVLQLSNTPLKNILLKNNICSSLNDYWGVATLNFQLGLGMTEEMIISNNIIVTNYSSGYIKPAVNVANQTLLTNNLFYSANGFQIFSNVTDCFITNNVFFGSSAASTGANYGNVYSNNLSYDCASYGGCDIPPASTSTPANTGSGNLSNTDPLYATLVDAWFWSADNSLDILDFSPIPDGGTDGTDIGVTGGLYPFKNYENLRGVPYVHQMSVPGLIMENQAIQLDAESRSNQ